LSCWHACPLCNSHVRAQNISIEGQIWQRFCRS